MKRKTWLCMGLSVMMVSGYISGCGQKSGLTETREIAGAPGTGETVSAAWTSETKKAVLETDETPETETAETSVKTKTYYLQTEEETSLVPSLTLFEDGTFGFSYDVLSSYFPNGTWEQTQERLTATTKDKEYQYVFRVDGDKYIFLQEESTDVPLIDKEFGVPIEDGSVFAMEPSVSEDGTRITGVVKEILEDRLLVSSKSDDYPGSYYVYFGDLDVSGIQEGVEIIVRWNGVVLETDPGQIYAEALELN